MLRFPRSRGTPAACSGFALVEALLVIALLGIVSGFAASRLDFTHYRVASAEQSVASSLASAERLALSLQHDVRVAFDTAGRRLRIHEDANDDGVINNGERVRYVALDDGVGFGRGATPALAVLGPTAVSCTRAQDGMAAVTFHRDGSADAEGGLYLNSLRDLRSGVTGDARAIVVTRSTGRLARFTWTGAAWREEN